MRYFWGFVVFALFGGWFLMGTVLGAGIVASFAAGTALAAFGLPFFALLALFFLIEFACVENESGVAATFTLGAFVAALYFFGGGLANPVIAFVVDYWVYIALGYFPMGALWMFLKWESILKRWDNSVMATKKTFIEKEGLTIKTTDPIPAEMKDKWFDFAGSTARKPDPNTYKSRFLLWIGYWPFSMAWSITRQLFIRLFNLFDDVVELIKRASLFVYDRCAGALRYMVNRRANKYDDDVK